MADLVWYLLPLLFGMDCALIGYIVGKRARR